MYRKKSPNTILFWCMILLGSLFIFKENVYAASCNEYDTQCIVCQAQVGTTSCNYTVKVTVVADGNGGATIAESSEEDTTNAPCGALSVENNLAAQNFVSESSQTLTCPNVYYAITQTNGGKGQKYTLQSEKPKVGYAVEFSQLETNNKPFKTSAENVSKSCQFQAKDTSTGKNVATVTITTDGKTITNMSATNGYEINSNFIPDASKFVNSEGELYCPSDEFHVSCGASGNNKFCTIQDSQEGTLLSPTESEEVKDADDLKNDIDANGFEVLETVGDCGMLSEILPEIETILFYIQIAAPIMLIIFGCIDFTVPILSNDKDALQKAFSKFVKRCIVTIVIFFTPPIIEWLLGILNDATASATDATLCNLVMIFFRF